MALLKSGVDFATISQWLGHARLNTIMRYARADLDLKRRALAQVFPDPVPPSGGRLLLDGADLIGWLRRLLLRMESSRAKVREDPGAYHVFHFTHRSD